MFYTLMHSSQQFGQIHLKCVQKRLKTLMMIFCEDCDFSPNADAVAAQQILILRHEKGKCCNLNVYRPICVNFLMFDESLGLNRFICQYSVIAIAPPTDNRKL